MEICGPRWNVGAGGFGLTFPKTASDCLGENGFSASMAAGNSNLAATDRTRTKSARNSVRNKAKMTFDPGVPGSDLAASFKARLKAM
jgi:hypothetical protein